MFRLFLSIDVKTVPKIFGTLKRVGFIGATNLYIETMHALFGSAMFEMLVFF